MGALGTSALIAENGPWSGAMKRVEAETHSGMAKNEKKILRKRSFAFVKASCTYNR